MSPQGVYPTADVCAIGDEISSTGEGRHITLYGDNLEHGSQVSYVTRGYGVWFGDAVGMPFKTQTLALGNPLMAIDTEGIWCVDVWGQDDAGNATVVPGEKLYINTTTGLVSKINNIASQLPFGYALGNVGSNATERIAVKVHWDPAYDTADRMYKTVTTGGFGKRWTGLLEAGASEGVSAYFDGQIDGQQTGHTYGFGMWIEPQAGWIGSAHLLVGMDVGFYANDTADPGLTRVIGFQYMSDWKIAPATMNVIRVNINQGRVANPMTAIWAFGNPESCGFIAAITESDAPVGYVPWADIVGYGVLYIRLYADQD